MLAPQQRGKPLVFLSYSRTDVNEVSNLRKDIIKAGIEVWWDQNILGGQDWKHEIREAMRRCDAVVLCLSDKAVSRTTSGLYPEALDAINAFRTYRPGEVYLIPVRFSDCTIPPFEIDGTRTLNCLQYIDLFPQKKKKEGMQPLIASIKSTLRDRGACDNVVELQQHKKTQEAASLAEQLIEITIDRDFESYTEADQAQFLRAVGEFLKMPSSDIRIILKRRGSIKIILSLPADKAQALCAAIQEGQLLEYNVVDAELKESVQESSWQNTPQEHLIEELSLGVLSQKPNDLDDQTSIMLRDAVRKAFNKLPPRQQEAFTLYEFYGMSYVEIAEELSCNTRQVGQLISQARDDLSTYILLYSLSIKTTLKPLSPRPGDSTKLWIRLHNYHSQDARNITVSIAIDDSEIGRFTVNVPGNGHATGAISWIHRSDYRVLHITLTKRNANRACGVLL
jgi:RNA polymerase sigma factor, sigma-70 family